MYANTTEIPRDHLIRAMPSTAYQLNLDTLPETIKLGAPYRSISLTGIQFETYIDNKHIQLLDCTDRRYHFYAEIEDRVRSIVKVKGQIVSFALFSKILDVRHSDLSKHAQEFLSGAHALLEYFNGEIGAILAKWNYGTNYEKYLRTLEETNDPIKAALSTWTGEQASRLGYKNVRKSPTMSETSKHMAFVFSK